MSAPARYSRAMKKLETQLGECRAAVGNAWSRDVELQRVDNRANFEAADFALRRCVEALSDLRDSVAAEVDVRARHEVAIDLAGSQK